MANFLGRNDKNIKSIATFLYSQCYKQTKGESKDTLVIITRGNNPVILANKDQVREFKVPVVQAQKKLNTSGAGDYFVGGFLANYIQNKPIQECMKSGLELACKLIEKNSLKY